MDLTLTSDQKAIQDTTRAFFDAHSTKSVVRESAGTIDAGMWKQLLELDAIHVAVARDGLLPVALMATEQGRSLAPIPLVESAVTARLLAAIDTPQSRRLLDDIAHGTVVTLALRPVVDGSRQLAPSANVAEAVVLMGADGLRLLRLTAGQAAQPDRTLGDAPLGYVDADGPSGSWETLLHEGGETAALFRSAVREWKVLTCSMLIGVAQGALELAVEYAKSRRQFGRPIGEFQAIAHSLADAATHLDAANLLTLEALWAVEEQREDAAALASMAVYFVADAAMKATATGVHVHGGYGITEEFDAQLYYRRAKAWILVHGDPQRELLEVADELF